MDSTFDIFVNRGLHEVVHIQSSSLHAVLSQFWHNAIFGAKVAVPLQLVLRILSQQEITRPIILKSIQSAYESAKWLRMVY